MADNPAAGATPVVDGATPPQTPPAQAGTASTGTTGTAPATGTASDAPLGEPGIAALERERQARRDADGRAKSLADELEKLKATTLSDTEKALAQARKDGAAEVLGKFQGQIRASEVRAGLTAAGINPSLLGLAVKADEFTGLKVSDTGEVDDLGDAVAAFKKAHPDLFGKPAGGSFDTGTGTGGRAAGKPIYTREQLRDPKFFAEHQADILLAQREGRIQVTSGG